MPRSLLILLVGGVAAALLVVGAGAFLWERPSVLTVAVSASDEADHALMGAVASLLKRDRRSVRLSLVPVANASEASAAVENGKADLAVVRTDLTVPSNGQTVVVLHRDVAILVAPGSGDVKEVADLADHTIGVIRDGPANNRLLETILAQYEIQPDKVAVMPLAPSEIADALKSKRVSAVLAVDVPSGLALHDVVKAVMAAGEGPPVFIDIAEADAISQRSPLYDKSEILRGTFGGSPPRPAEEFDTLSITHRLMANEKVDVDAITDLTRFLLQERLALAASVPLARRIEAPPTDKGAALPVHEGTAAYIDDEEQTFFDKYSDMIYIGAMLLGVLASGATALLGRVSARRTATLDGYVTRLMEMLAEVRAAASPSGLEQLQAEADTLLASALGHSGGAVDESRLRVFGLALDQVRDAARDRRVALFEEAARHGESRSPRVPAAAE